MATQATVNSVFNNQFFQLLEFVQSVYPENLDIMNATTSFQVTLVGLE